MGMPERAATILDATYGDATIAGVNQGSKTFTTDGRPNQTAVGRKIVVAGSAGNDRSYDVTAVGGTLGAVTITVQQTIPSATPGGRVTFTWPAWRQQFLADYYAACGQPAMVEDPTASPPLRLPTNAEIARFFVRNIHQDVIATVRQYRARAQIDAAIKTVVAAEDAINPPPGE